MAVIEKEIELVGSRGREKVKALFDSGATYSCIRKELASRVDVVVALPDTLEFGTADSGTKMKVEEAVRLDFYIGEYRFSDEFLIVPALSENLIIGAATLQKWRFKLDFENDEVLFDPAVTKLRLL